MASGSQDEIKGAWYFGSSQYDPQSSSDSEQEPTEMVEQQGEQHNHHKPGLSSEMRHLKFQEMLSMRTTDSLPYETFQKITEKYGYHFGKKLEEDNGRLRIQVRIPTQLLREAVAFVNQNRNQQASQTVAENEDVTQSSNAI